MKHAGRRRGGEVSLWRQFQARVSSASPPPPPPYVFTGEGHIYRLEHAFHEQDLATYAKLLGDANPIHSQKAAAQAAGFQECVVHGMLCASLFPAVIRSSFPGAVFESKSLRFKEPALVGDLLEAEAKVVHMAEEKNSSRIKFSMELYKKAGRILVLEGSSTVLVPSSL